VAVKEKEEAEQKRLLKKRREIRLPTGYCPVWIINECCSDPFSSLELLLAVHCHSNAGFGVDSLLPLVSPKILPLSTPGEWRRFLLVFFLVRRFSFNCRKNGEGEGEAGPQPTWVWCARLAESGAQRSQRAEAGQAAA
jgi:hypothetical protein